MSLLLLLASCAGWSPTAIPEAAPTPEVARPWGGRDGWQNTREPSEVDPPEGAPNVVVVLGCTLRRDMLTPYGGPDTATPFLNRLAREGARFEDAIASAPWTKAASVGLLTSQHAVALDMVEPGPGRNLKVLAPDVTTLAERFAASGWQTVGMTANPNLNAVFGMAQGFDAWRDADNFDRPASELVHAALERIGTLDGTRPWYLQLMLTDVHDPRPAATTDRYTAEGDKVAGYLEALEGLDAQLERLAEGVGSDTLFVVVADHGEGLSRPRHHGVGHGVDLYPSTVRIPWLVRGPGVAAGHVVDGVVSGVDLAPTVLELAGVPMEEGFGVSHGAALRGGGSSTRERAWTDSWFYKTNRAAWWTPQRQCQLDLGTPPGRRDRHVDGCFQRLGDPELTRPASRAAGLQRIRDWRTERLAEQAARTPSGTAVLEEGLSAQLEALGYAE